jgi:hypothetical protein
MFANLSQSELAVSDMTYMPVAGAVGAKETLLRRGFTSVRG